jgi:hypothetical protein
MECEILNTTDAYPTASHPKRSRIDRSLRARENAE